MSGVVQSVDPSGSGIGLIQIVPVRMNDKCRLQPGQRMWRARHTMAGSALIGVDGVWASSAPCLSGDLAAAFLNPLQ